MTAAYLALWLAYSLYWLKLNLFGMRTTPRVLYLLQGGMLILACIWAARTGVFSRYLWSPADVAAGLVAGHMLFALSLLLISRSRSQAAEQLADARGLLEFMGQTPGLMFRFLGICVIEELIYRAAAQSMLLQVTGSPVLAIVATAAGFCFVHPRPFRKGWTSSLEFIAFALLIGVLYHVTFSLTLVVLVHFVRNMETTCLEFYALQDEHGDREQALRALEQECTQVESFPPCRCLFRRQAGAGTAES